MLDRKIAGEEAKPEARYAYYRRCQVFKKSGRQCKAPAEKGAEICWKHAGQIETEIRRERERWAVLEITAEQMRRAGREDFTVGQIFDDPRAILTAINVVSQALVNEIIDDKTAARVLNELHSALASIQPLGRSHSIPKLSGADPSVCRPRDDIHKRSRSVISQITQNRRAPGAPLGLRPRDDIHKEMKFITK